MKHFIFSSILGIFVFDESYDIIKKLPIDQQDIEKLRKNEWLEKELSLVKELKGRELFYIGNKSAKQEGIKLTQDPAKIDRILNLFADKRYFNDFYKSNLVLAKKAVRESVKFDNLALQAINSIEELNKIANTIAKRLREWYELYLPEFSKSLKDHEKFSEIIAERSKDELLKEIKLKKEESMGADLEKSDLEAILNLAGQLKDIYILKQKQDIYLKSLMEKNCPNITAVAGHLIGAKLIAIAGDLKRLAEFPSSTVQVLGAEKALFRHIKTGAKAPKHGVIIGHILVAAAKQNEKGKVARALADKISLAAKVDYFKGEFIGNKLRKVLEEKFKGHKIQRILGLPEFF